MAEKSFSNDNDESKQTENSADKMQTTDVTSAIVKQPLEICERHSPRTARLCRVYRGRGGIRIAHRIRRQEVLEELIERAKEERHAERRDKSN